MSNMLWTVVVFQLAVNTHDSSCNVKSTGRHTKVSVKLSFLPTFPSYVGLKSMQDVRYIRMEVLYDRDHGMSWDN